MVKKIKENPVLILVALALLGGGSGIGYAMQPAQASTVQVEDRMRVVEQAVAVNSAEHATILADLRELKGDLKAVMNTGMAARRTPRRSRRRRGLAAALLGLALSGCATWPEQCPLKQGVRQCQCANVTVDIESIGDRPAPAGKMNWRCDGQPIPLVVIGEEVPSCK